MLILLGELAQGHGPVLYLAPDNYLVSQVRAKTKADPGVDTVDDPDSPEYISGAKIAVVNIHKLFNAMSVFGGPASMRGRPLKIGTVVIDDAHAALVTTDAQCTATIPAELDACHELLELFRRDLEQQSSEALTDIETKAPGGVGRGAVPRSRRMNNAATASPAHAPMLGVGVPREEACCSSGAVSWA